MPCYKPKIMADSIKYVNGVRLRGKSIRVPCGSCIGCRLEYSRQWAMRCHHESKMHEQNSFLRLSFNESHLPSNRSISKRDLQLFFKRLRKKLYPKEVKYYACGEYGDSVGHRPHYHVCLFGHDFEDKKIHEYGTGKRSKAKPNKGVFDIYKSEVLEKVWGQGYCAIGELTFDSAAYCARYIVKKITGPYADKHYNGLTPEFCLASQGIGKSFFNKYFNDIYPKDFVTINGKKLSPCRYYDHLLMHKDLDLYLEIKERRKENIVNEGETRLYHKEQHKNEIIKTLKRRYDHEQ